MQFQKISAPSLKELFVEQLEGKILSGELPIGSKLPSERELATSMQVSRAVVNAGIAELEQKGFLVIKPRIGTFVEDYRKYGTLDTLVSIMKYNGGALANAEVRSILQLRIVLVSLAGVLTADEAPEEAFASLDAIVDDIRDSATNESLVENTFRFYHELGFVSGNSLLPLIFTSFKDLVCMLWQRYVINYGRESLIASTEKLYSLIRQRDRDAIIAYIDQSTSDSIDGSKQIYL